MADEQPARKTAIVTGASSGVGRDTATLLAEATYAVVMVARDEAKLNAAVGLIRDDIPGAELEVVPADVSQPDAVRAAVGRAVEKYGGVNVVANVAGSAPLQPIDKITDEGLAACLAVNLNSVVYITRAVWPVMKRAGGGVICNVSSLSAFDPFTGFNIYGAAKAGVNLFTKATAAEGKRAGIKAVAVAPGAIETPMLRANFSEKAIPAEKTLDPMVVAQLIVDLLTGRRKFDPGETIQVPGP